MSGGSGNLAGDGIGSALDKSYATVGGGKSNWATGYYSTIPGGEFNSANGDYSFAAGNGATADHSGAFVWSDGSGSGSTAANQFLIQARGGVGIGTNAPAAQLHVRGNSWTTLVVEAATNDPALWMTSNASVVNSDWSMLMDVSDAKKLQWRYDNAAKLTMTTAGDVGIGTATPSAKLSVTGSVCATGFGACSDRRFKEHIEPVTGALATLAKIQGVRFDWKRAEFPEREFSDQRQIGFIAQEVLEVLPEVVQQGTDGYYNVDYGRLTPMIVEAVKEQQAELDSVRGENARLVSRSAAQQSEIDTLMSRVAALERALSANAQPARPVSLASIGGFAIPALALLGFVGLVVRGRSQNGGGR